MIMGGFADTGLNVNKYSGRSIRLIQVVYRNFKTFNFKEEVIMRIKRFSALFLTIGLVLALAVGCATTKPAEDTAKAASPGRLEVS